MRLAANTQVSREQALDYTSVRRRIAGSLRFVDPPSLGARINTHREGKRKDTGLVARFASRNLPSSFLQTNIFLFIVSYASVKSSARRNTKCHLLGNIMPPRTWPPLPVSSPSSSFTLPFSRPPIIAHSVSGGHIRARYQNGISNMPIPKSNRHTTHIPVGRGRGEKSTFRTDLERMAHATGRTSTVDHRGKRKGVTVTKGATREKETLTRVARLFPRTSESACTIYPSYSPPESALFVRRAHRAFLLSPDTGNNRREIGDRQRHFVAGRGARAARRPCTLSLGRPLTSGDLFQAICRVSIIFN